MLFYILQVNNISSFSDDVGFGTPSHSSTLSASFNVSGSQPSNNSNITSSTPVTITEVTLPTISASPRAPSGGDSEISTGGDSDKSGRKLVVIKHLPGKMVNCNRLFNLLWQYGHIHQINFVFEDSEDDFTAEVTVDTIDDAERIVVMTDSSNLLGKKPSAYIKPLNQELEITAPFELTDGSPSLKSFSLVPPSLSVENAMPPSKVLIFQLSGPLSKAEIISFVERMSNSKVADLKFEDIDESAGFLLFNTSDDSIEALMAVLQRSYKNVHCSVAFEIWGFGGGKL